MFDGLENAARAVAADLSVSLVVECEVSAYSPAEEDLTRQRLTEKRLPQQWDLLIHGHGAQFAESVVPELGVTAFCTRISRIFL